MTDHLCYGCKTFQDIFYIQPETGLEFCRECSLLEPLTVEDWAMFFLATPGTPLGPPFTAGDVVEARTAALIYDGIGVVKEMSMQLKHGGTPVYPTWRVEITEKAYPEAPDECWYTECCLTKVKQEVKQ